MARKEIKINNDMQAKAKTLPDGKTKAKYSAGDGLYLLVNQSGKYWRYAYRYDGTHKEASLGVYIPGSEKHVSLKSAKGLVQGIKDLLKEGIDPNQHKRDKKQAKVKATREKTRQQEVDANTFEVIARQWHGTHKDGWSAKHASTILRRFELHVFPFIGSVPVAQITKAQVADVLTAIVEHGTVEIAKRIKQIIRQVLEYASDKGLIVAIPMGKMDKLIPKRKAKPMPAITKDPKRIGEFMRAIHAYQGSFVVCCALKLLPCLAVRSGEFRQAEWSEFDLDAALWTIPANHRKLPKDEKENPDNVHIVPLSKQAVSILRDLQQLTGTGKHVFPSARGDSRPMSENAINAAIHAMGFKGEMVGHGVRAMFSTSLNEQRFNPDAIERQLAHGEKNAVRAAYSRGEYMEERTIMMQHWADYLDGLREGADVIPIGREAK